MAAEGADEEFDALPVVPLGDKKLRACLVTGLVKTEDQVRGTRYRLPRKIYREHSASALTHSRSALAVLPRGQRQRPVL